MVENDIGLDCLVGPKVQYFYQCSASDIAAVGTSLQVFSRELNPLPLQSPADALRVTPKIKA